jgi:hypothetical protein
MVTEAMGQPEGIAYFKSVEAALSSKVDLMLTSMADNPRWLGCLSWVEQTPLTPELFEIFKDGICTSEGSRPVVSLNKNNSKRTGCAAVPFHGVGSLYYGTYEGVVWLLCVPMAAHLQEGISMDSLERYCDTEQGEKMMKDISLVIPVLRGAIVYVPAGFTVYTVSHEAPERNKEMGTYHYAHVALSGPFANDMGLDRTTRHAILTSNESHMLGKINSSRMWKARDAFFKSIFTADP